MQAGDRLVASLVDVLAELLHTHGHVISAQKKLTVDVFSTAVRSLNKLGCSVKVGDLQGQVMMLGDSVADRTAQALLTAGKNLISVYSADAKKGLQTGWIKALMVSDRRTDLEGIDTAVIAALDHSAGQLWLAISCAKQAAAAEANFAAKPELPSQKDEVKDTVLHFIQLAGLNSDDMATFGIQNVDRYKVAAQDRLSKTMTHLAGRIMDAKEFLMNRPYKNFEKILPAVDAWTDDSHQQAVSDALLEAQAIEDAKDLLQNGVIDGPTLSWPIEA